MKRLFLLALFLLCASSVRSKKSVLEYNEADVERIYRQWDENDDDDDDDDDMLRPPQPPQGSF